MQLRTLTALALAGALLLPACGGTDAGAGGASDRLDVVVGLYPYEYVASRVGGDDATVRNLTAPGAEPHDLELTPQQVGQIGSADLVLYSAGLQPAVDEAVEQQAEDRALDVMRTVEVRRDDGAEGEEHAQEEAEAHGEQEGAASAEQGDDHDHAGEDPHVWLDPTRLSTIADAVAERMAELAPDRADAFRANAQQLQDELASLDADLEAGLSSCERTELVTSHDAFGYLADRYGLEQVAISGLSPEDEPSPRRLAEVATFAQERGVTTIFFEELVSPRVAESLAREVGAEATVLSPLEGPPQDGDYLDAMRANLDTLRTALGCT